MKYSTLDILRIFVLYTFCATLHFKISYERKEIHGFIVRAIMIHQNVQITNTKNRRTFHTLFVV